MRRLANRWDDIDHATIYILERTSWMAPSYINLVRKWGALVNNFARLPMSVKKGLITFALGLFGFSVCLIYFHDTEDSLTNTYLGCVIVISATSLVWAWLLAYYLSIALYITFYYTYTISAIVLVLTLFLLVQLLMYLCSELLWVLHGHFYEALGGPMIERATRYLRESIWHDLTAQIKLLWRDEAAEKRKRDFQRRKCLNIIVNPISDAILEEVTQDMTKVLMTDAKYWLNEGGKVWNEEIHKILYALKSESDTLVDTVQNEIALVEEANCITSQDIRNALSLRKTESRDYWRIYDCLHLYMIPEVERRFANLEFLADLERRKCRELASNAMSRIIENLEIAEEDRLSKLNISSQYWRSAWKAYRQSHLKDYNSLQDVFHFGPPSRHEQRWHAHEAVHDIINSIETESVINSDTPNVYQFAHSDHWQVHDVVEGVVSNVNYAHGAVHNIVSSVADVHDTIHDVVAAVEASYLDIFSVDAVTIEAASTERKEEEDAKLVELSNSLVKAIEVSFETKPHLFGYSSVGSVASRDIFDVLSIFNWCPEAETEAIKKELSSLLLAEYNLISAESSLRQAELQASQKKHDAKLYSDSHPLSIFSFKGVEDDALGTNLSHLGEELRDKCPRLSRLERNYRREEGEIQTEDYVISSAGELQRKTVAQRLDDQRHKAEATVAKARAEVLTAHEQMTNELSAAEALSRTRVKARLQRRKKARMQLSL